MRMRLHMLRRGEARGAEDRFGDGDMVFWRLGVVERIDLRLLADRTTVGDLRLKAVLSEETGPACWLLFLCGSAVFCSACSSCKGGDGLGALAAGLAPERLGDRLQESMGAPQACSMDESAGAGDGNLE